MKLKNQVRQSKLEEVKKVEEESTRVKEGKKRIEKEGKK